MLINAQLPIDINRLQEQDQTFSLAGMSWDDYEQFKTAEYPGYRVSFFSGVITLVSPSKNHERIRETMAILIVAYCRKFNLPYFPWGSTRLTNKPNAGKEPDLAYCFGMDKDIPDLAIEVVFSSGGVEDLIKYQSIGVSEVWFWQDHKVSFFQMQADSYVKVKTSACLPQLSSQILEFFVNRGFIESPLTIELDFRKQL